MNNADCSQDIVIVGAGGLAREIEWTIRRINSAADRKWNFIGYIANNKEDAERYRMNVLGDDDWLLKQTGLSVIIGIGNPTVRLKVANKFLEKFSDEIFPVIVDPSVIMDDRTVSLGAGSIITAGCVLTVNVDIQPFAYLNLNCTIGHESVVGRASILNPTVKISGGVNIGDGALIGTGATILQYLNIGGFSTVGAGAVVTKDVAPQTTVVGIPAKELRV